MPKYLTVKRFHECYRKYFRNISVQTIYRWIEEGTLQAKKDRDGFNWLIIISEDDDLYKFLK